MRNIAIAIGMLLFLSHNAAAQKKYTPEEYLEQYKEYAIIEMHRSGVPASITLAQGMLESSNGNSRLATEAMNHFGIKCKSTWTGEVIYANDDAPDECFRAYRSVLESYKDHSDFLRQNWRYHELFELNLTDYKGWARGLKRAGYATNPKYHIIITNLIERHELYKYDVEPLPQRSEEMIVTHNDIPVVYAKEGDNAKKIADENDLRQKHIYKYNDLEPGSEIKVGELIYLKPKRRKGSVEFHTYSPGESMYMISQRYGIKLKHLYKKNRLIPGVEPKVGEKLNLQNKRSKTDSLQTQNQTEQATNEIIQKNFVNPHTIIEEKAPPIQKIELEVPEFHTVVSGDNIYRISEKYHVFEEDILKWNNLKTMQLSIGQKLYLSEEAALKYIGGNNPVKDEVIIIDEKPAPPPVVDDKKYHTVVAGETLYRICQNYGVTQEQIKKWNKMSDVKIYVGQKLRIAE